MATTAEIQASTAAILAAVTAEKDAVAAVTQLVAGLKQQLADAIANGASPADLQAILDTVNANDAALAALTNTPAAPTA